MTREGEYTTIDECDFINKLGKDRPLEERIRLVTNYESSIRLRSDWGGIDPVTIRTHVDGVLNMLRMQRVN